MFHSVYKNIVETGAVSTRRREREALERSVELLKLARESGFRSHRGAEAIYTTNRVWSFLIEDLSLSDNELPDAVRANLISIGIHVLKRLSDLRAGETGAADDIIEITEIIQGGLA
ncbi:MAG: flagellar biosynthesis regulator FlaF [Notoacmeibacter sp.]